MVVRTQILPLSAILLGISTVATVQGRPQAAAPNSRPPFDSLAQEQIRLGQFAQARALYEQALALNPAALEALTGVGDTYTLAGDYVAARRSYERLLARSASLADTVQAHLRIAEALTFAGDIEGAESILARGIRVVSAKADPPLELTLVSRLNALQRWNGELSQAEETIAQMERLGMHESFPEAIRRANVLRSIQLLAMVHAKRGDEASARRLANEYILGREKAALPPQREMTLGLVASYLGRYAEAIELLERASETESMSYLQYYLGLAHAALGYRGRARQYFERVSLWRGLAPVDRLQLPLVRDLARRRLLEQQ